MAKTYFSMNEVPIGTEMIVKSSGVKGKLIGIQNFPTMFKVENEKGEVNNYYTYEVEILGWPNR